MPSFRKHSDRLLEYFLEQAGLRFFFRPTMEQLTTPKLGLTIYNVIKLAWQQFYNIIGALLIFFYAQYRGVVFCANFPQKAKRV